MFSLTNQILKLPMMLRFVVLFSINVTYIAHANFEVINISHKKVFDELRTKRTLDQLEYETSKELGLGEEYQQLKQNMFRLEKTKYKVEAGEEAMNLESTRKVEENIEDKRK
ncbi:hypothetical protein [Desulfolucanica intricata]|uniref:hypothetical protein n=1 Tax=Desulfolucanica intricata TaxID=1285191 RepID=UPI000830F0FF|nr:hypothetical protein [Desulfolucanica intricata]